MSNIIVVGMGPVGRKTYELLQKSKEYDIYAYDAYKYNTDYPLAKCPDEFDIVFICTPTECALTEANSWHAKNINAKIVIRSTLPIEEAWIAKGNKYTLWPEFDVTETQNKGSDLIVITKDGTLRSLLLSILPMNTNINIVDHKEAAAIKIFDNFMLNSLVKITNKLHSVCENNDLEWDIIRNVLVQDKRYPKSHNQFISHNIKSKCFELADKLIEQALK